MAVEEEKHKLIRHFKDIFDIHIPLAKLINVNIESKSSDFRKQSNSNLTLDLIISRTSDLNRPDQVKAKSIPLNLDIKQKMNFESHENIVLEDVTTPLSYDSGDINVVTSSVLGLFTENTLKFTKNISFIFNTVTEATFINSIKKSRPVIPSLDTTKDDQAVENSSMKTSAIQFSTFNVEEKEIEFVQVTYPSGPIRIFKSPDNNTGNQGVKLLAGGVGPKSAGILDQLDQDITTVDDKEIFLSTLTPINEDSDDSGNLPIYEESSITTVANYKVSSNSIPAFSDTDFFTTNIEKSDTTFGYEVKDAFIKVNQLTTPFEEVAQSTIGLHESISLDLNKAAMISSTTRNVKQGVKNKNNLYSTMLPSILDLENNRGKNLKPKLNETTYHNLNIINNTMRTMTNSGNNDNYLGDNIFSTITISLASSFVFVLIVFVIVSLFIIRKHKFQSKIYLSYELGKPRSYSTKPMRPSILVEESQSSEETNHFNIHFEKPKRPIYLDQELGIYNLQTNISGSVESCDSGIDNVGFVGCSSEEVKENSSLHDNKCDKSSTKKHSLPKYTPKKKKFNTVDSRFKVCSSEGNIYYTSPSLTKCLVPPPPYSPRLLNRSCNKTDTVSPIGKYSSSLPFGSSLDFESMSSAMQKSDILSANSTSTC